MLQLSPARTVLSSTLAVLLFTVAGCGSSGTTASVPTATITTVAGTGVSGRGPASGIPANSAALGQVSCVALDAAGNLYIGDLTVSVVYKVTASTGALTYYAGNGVNTYAGNGGLATNASFYAPSGCAMDAAGNLYVSDDANNVIRKITASTGIITTVAGNGYEAGTSSGGSAGDGGLATNAELNHSFGVAVDAGGNLFISDTYNQRVREVNATTGIITTIAGTGVEGYSGSGVVAVNAPVSNPEQLYADNLGNLYIAEQGACVISKLNLSSGIKTTVAGTGVCGDSSGTGLFVKGDGGPATQALLSGPQGVTMNSAGNLFIADSNSQRIREVNMSTGVINTVVGSSNGYSGDGGNALNAQLHNPWGLAFDAAGNLYIADYYNYSVRKVTGLK